MDGKYHFIGDLLEAIVTGLEPCKHIQASYSTMLQCLGINLGSHHVQFLLDGGQVPVTGTETDCSVRYNVKAIRM